jgi:general secretion pathway protein A
MYTSYWGLSAAPFENVPTQELFYESPQHEEALVRLVYAVEHKKGLAVLTGEVGSGKTTISRVLYDYLSTDGFEVVTIVNPTLSPVDFYRALLLKLGEPAEEDSKTILLDRFSQRLIQNFEHEIGTILIIDEAHLIKDRAILEELRMMLNLQHENQFLVTLLLMGQPPLGANIASLKPLKERVAIRYDLMPLSFKDTARYILFRLKQCGARRGIFTKAALKPLYKHSGGIPLKINNLCERSLLIGMMNKARVVDSKIVEEAVADMK